MREDAVGKPGYTPIQKCTAAIRQLAYGGAADMFDEYLHIGESTARECLEFFCQGVREIFGDTSSEAYPPRLPGFDDYARESAWVSENVGQHRLYALGMEELPIRLERVVHNRFQEQESHDSGSNSDINVLQSSPLLNDQELGVGPAVSFVANGNQHNMGYYLADEIYPMWPVFVKTIRCATEDRKNILRVVRRQRARMWSGHLVCSRVDGRTAELLESGNSSDGVGG
ncbi:uncharacterized protein LOC125195059 [Salvia hispanica]|uniref:uncharacterized protein LOC125195059 n=1 Tax=Salvia hispanica TaxID=49212 RepID=UPI00200957BB|nr:uncharacterized protein LOC125195059 [Salvia hispanica]